MAPRQYESVEACVDYILKRTGREVVLGTPLGIGKPNHVVNELVERTLENPEIDLEIWTALTLAKPKTGEGLKRRLAEPIADRIFGDYPDPAYEALRVEDRLPENIEVHEFYYPPGAYLRSDAAQQNHHSVNYTHVLREMEAAGVNVIAQLVGIGRIDGRLHYNLSSNTDLSADIIPRLRERRATGGEDAVIVGQVNRNLPFMYGDAPILPDQFDAVLDDEELDYPLFAPPKHPIAAEDYAIGLGVSSLIKDGGTLQIGIGSLGDAIAWTTQLRHQRNDDYRELVDAFGVADGRAEFIDDVGGLAPFEEGLYGGTEMFVEAFLHLLEAGVVDREVYDDCAIQKLINEGKIGEAVDLETLEALVEEGAVGEPLTADDVDYLVEWGVFRDEVEWVGGHLEVDDRRISASLEEADAREAIEAHCLGEELAGGHLVHAAFFMGPSSFYESLREMDEELKKKLGMRSVHFTNQLYRHEELNRLQRRDARFVNAAMKATVTGAVVSDGLEDNRVVSGVGGQYNFVTMAHELEGGRSIIMVRSTRESGGEVESNIVWNYGHVTIPRHLRDIVVTEYGIADLRGKSDREVVAEMIQVADSRFQQELVEQAKAHGKLPADWEVPERHRGNYPEALEEKVAEYREEGLLPELPYGSDLTDLEVDLSKALTELKAKVESRDWRELVDMDAIPKAISVPPEAEPYLERLDLDDPSGAREVALQRLAAFALAEADVI